MTIEMLDYLEGRVRLQPWAAKNFTFKLVHLWLSEGAPFLSLLPISPCFYFLSNLFSIVPLSLCRIMWRTSDTAGGGYTNMLKELTVHTHILTWYINYSATFGYMCVRGPQQDMNIQMNSISSFRFLSIWKFEYVWHEIFYFNQLQNKQSMTKWDQKDEKKYREFITKLVQYREEGNQNNYHQQYLFTGAWNKAKCRLHVPMYKRFLPSGTVCVHLCACVRACAFRVCAGGLILQGWEPSCSCRHTHINKPLLSSLPVPSPFHIPDPRW